MESDRDPVPSPLSERVLLLAPTGLDAPLLAEQLRQHGVTVEVCADIGQVCRELQRGVGAVFIAEEALRGDAMQCLLHVLRAQPAWSDVPVIIMTVSGRSPARRSEFDVLRETGSVTLLDRPIRLATLFSVIDSALKSRRRQYEVRNLLEEFRRGVEQRDRFLAMLGHELRNPLAAIVSAVSILRNFGSGDRELTEEQHEVIARQSSHMARLVDDLLDVARITAGKITLNVQPIDLREVANRSLQALKLTMPQQRHEISLDAPPHPVVVNGDLVRLEQVVMNLLTNAVKYTPEGGRIHIAVRYDADAVLSVRDSGEGIQAEMMQRIFEPFMQVEQSLERSRGGLGMGLTVVKSLVEMHGGQIAANSPGPGRGTEFTIRLPLLQQQPAPVRHYVAQRPDNHRHVLLVEDNPDSRRTLGRLLKLFGHKVETADDGPSGLRKALEVRPEVVLLDIGLPGMDGYEVARGIRRELGEEVFLIAVTGYGQSEDRERVKRAGFDLHLVKPLDPEHLNQVLGSRRCTRNGVAKLNAEK